MAIVDELSKMRSLYEQGVLTDRELSWAIVTAILDGKISTFDDCRDFVAIDIRDVMLEDITAIESNDYMDPNPFVKNGLSDQEKKERSLQLRDIYESVFSEIRCYFENRTEP